MHIEIESEHEGILRGFRFFWLKRVRGYDLRQHCAKCLVGPFEREFWGGRTRCNVKIPVKAYEGEIFYLCGVAEPYRWKNNFHLPFVAEAGAEASAELFTGDVARVTGGRLLRFTDDLAKEVYESRGPSFVTCRNFQFAVYMASRSSGAKVVGGEDLKRRRRSVSIGVHDRRAGNRRT